MNDEDIKTRCRSLHSKGVRLRGDLDLDKRDNQLKPGLLTDNAKVQREEARVFLPTRVIGFPPYVIYHTEDANPKEG
jgi:hypothetical protein